MSFVAGDRHCAAHVEARCLATLVAAAAAVKIVASKLAAIDEKHFRVSVAAVVRRWQN